MKFPMLLSIAVTTLFLLPGCGESSAPKTVIQKRATVAVETIPPRISYAATLAEGIDFKRDGYPTFVATTKGISDKEFFGRWSTDDEVVIELVDPLPAKFTIELKAAAFVPNVGKPFIMTIGETQRNFVLDTGNPEKMKDVSMSFEVHKNTKTIRIIIPHATSPKTLANSADERRLGIALGALRIIESASK